MVMKLQFIPSVVGATLGAAAIERHITLDRAMYGMIKLHHSTRVPSIKSDFKKYPNYSW